MYSIMTKRKMTVTKGSGKLFSSYVSISTAIIKKCISNNITANFFIQIKIVMVPKLQGKVAVFSLVIFISHLRDSLYLYYIGIHGVVVFSISL
jgi:hypothetical protein